MFVNRRSSCCFTLKDRKPNFLNYTQSSLTKPSQKQTWQNQQIHIRQNKYQRTKFKQSNQWKSTSEVIEWFKNIRNKQKHKFILFDIKDFYLTIMKDLLTKCFNFAQEKVQIFSDDKKIIHHARKSLLFNERGEQIKKDGLFDVTMGAYDGAEVCELVGTFSLDKISEKYDKNSIDLYRDDGLSVFKNKSDTHLNIRKKILQKIFKDFGLEQWQNLTYEL